MFSSVLLFFEALQSTVHTLSGGRNSCVRERLTASVLPVRCERSDECVLPLNLMLKGVFSSSLCWLVVSQSRAKTGHLSRRMVDVVNGQEAEEGNKSAVKTHGEGGFPWDSCTPHIVGGSLSCLRQNTSPKITPAPPAQGGGRMDLVVLPRPFAVVILRVVETHGEFEESGLYQIVWSFCVSV
jgi:hypothetical protein